MQPNTPNKKAKSTNFHPSLLLESLVPTPLPLAEVYGSTYQGKDIFSIKVPFFFSAQVLLSFPGVKGILATPPKLPPPEIRV